MTTQTPNRFKNNDFVDATTAYLFHDFENAIKLFSLYLEENGDDNDTRFRLGLSLYRNHRHQDAFDELFKCLPNIALQGSSRKKKSENFGGLLLLEFCDIFEKQIEDRKKFLLFKALCHFVRHVEIPFDDYHTESAVSVLSSLLKIDKNNEDAYFYRAFAFSKLCKIDEATKDMNKALKINPQNKHNYLARAGCFDSNAKYEEAKEDCTKVIEFEDTEASDFVKRAGCFFASGKYQEVIQDISKAVEMCGAKSIPHYAYFMRGASKISLGDLDGAIEDFYIAQQHTKHYGVNTFGANSIWQGNEAVDAFTAALSKDKNNYDLIIGLGISKYLRNKPGPRWTKMMEANEDFLRAAEINPNTAEPYSLIVENMMSHGKTVTYSFEKIEHYINLVLSIEPENIEALSQKAMHSSSEEERIDLVNKILKISNKINDNVGYNCLFSIRNIKDLDIQISLLNQLEKSCSEPPCNKTCKMVRGLNYFKQNKFELALDDLLFLLRQNPEQSVMLEKLSVCLSMLGKEDKAKAVSDDAKKFATKSDKSKNILSAN